MMQAEGLDSYLTYAQAEEGKRIYNLLKLIEQDSVYDFSQQSLYEESVLSREVRQYFGQYASAADIPAGPGGEMPKTGNRECLLQQICSVLELDEFERMCVTLSVLGEVNGYVEKFFVYMNNDWNNGYLTIDTAIRLYTQDTRTDIGFYPYFLTKSRLSDYVFTFHRQEGKGRGRWGLKLRDSFFRLLFADVDGFLDDFPVLSWYRKEMMPEGGNTELFDQMDNIGKKDKTVIHLCKAADSGKEIVGTYCGSKGHDVCFIDMCRLIMLVEKNGLSVTLKEFCHLLFLWLAVGDAWLGLCFGQTEPLKEECSSQVIIDLLGIFQRKGIRLFIVGDGLPDCLRGSGRIWELSANPRGQGEYIQIWRRTAEQFPIGEEVELDYFAGIYQFDEVQIRRIFRRANDRRILGQRSTILQEDIREGCIRETKCHGSHLVNVMHTGYGWEDLVLPDRQREQLKIACNRVLYRRQVYQTWGFGRKLAYGRGVSMIFSGPPGTGKTMSAGIIAEQLGTTLYRVNLAAAVSKYIGETEKNLHDIFETVKKGQGVLFFDEADVLFGRRTEVRNSNDKHSNMEAAYLLQKMEEYEGVVILATNYMQNMDEAFKRRIQFLIEFPFPDMECRRRLWEKAFPDMLEFGEAPDYAFLARQFELSGSHIKNIALQAAFFAADEKEKVEMKHIIKALIMEIRKTGKRISREDLGEYHTYYENN